MRRNEGEEGGEQPSVQGITPPPEIDARQREPRMIEATTREGAHSGLARRSRHRRNDSSPPTPSFPTKRRARVGGGLPSESAERNDASQAPIHIVEADDAVVGDGDVLRRQHPSRTTLPQEVDFYRNPTILGRCIVNQKYGNAVKRALQQPEEAKIWLCSKRNTDDNKYTIRQLPIHIACANLMCTYDDRQSTVLNELIALLVMSYPEGANTPDHRDRLPLLEALWYGADAQTLAIFFVANPEALNTQDKKGRTLTDLNRYRNGLNKVEVQNLIDKGASFWRKAREEVFLRLQIGHVSVPVGRNDAASDNEIASSQPGDDSVLDEEANVLSETSEQEVVALSWDQLEKRSMAAEKILAEVNERNYDLSRRVEASATLENLVAKELLQELQRLRNVNAVLARKIRSIESILEKHVLKGEKEVEGQLRLALAEVSSLAALSDKTSLSDQSGYPGALRKVTKQTQQLTRRQEEQRERVRKIKFVIDSLSEGGGHDSSVTAYSELSSKSNYSTDLRNAPGLIVDRTPATRLKANNLELEAIFKYGAAYDFARRFPDLGEANADDLELILKWAASQESVMSFSEVDITSSYSPEKPLLSQHAKIGNLHQREIKLPALLPYDETGVDVDSSYFEESQAVPGEQSLEDVDPILLTDEYAGVLSETQVSI